MDALSDLARSSCHFPLKRARRLFFAFEGQTAKVGGQRCKNGYVTDWHSRTLSFQGSVLDPKRQLALACNQIHACEIKLAPNGIWFAWLEHVGWSAKILTHKPYFIVVGLVDEITALPTARVVGKLQDRIRAIAVKADLGRLDEGQKLLDEAIAACGRLDIVVLNTA